MKKALVIIVLLFPFLVQGQITIMEIPQDTNAKTEHIIVYDSLTNIRTRKNNNQFSYSHLIGQTIMSCEKHYMGKYYTIDSILPDDPRRGLYDRICLTDTATGEVRILGGLGINNDTKHNRFFVVVGHYEKMKSLYIGRKLVYVGEKGAYLYESKRDKLIDVNTGKVATDVKTGSIWTCVDVQVKPTNESSRESSYNDYYFDNRSPLVLVFENPQYGKCYCYYESKPSTKPLPLSAETKESQQTETLKSHSR